jgi:sugar phosphate permease
MNLGAETARLPQDLPSPRDRVYQKIMWRIIPFLIVCYVVAFLNRQNVGFAKLQFMHDLRFTETVYGIGGGMFYLGYILFEIPSNLYMARSGVRKTLLRIMVLWGLCAATMAFMKGQNQFYVLRGLLGAAEAGMFPGVLLYLTYWIPASRRAYFTAMFMFSIGVTGIIGGPLSGGIMGWLEGAGGLKGWQWLFIVDGLPSCLLGVVAYFVLSDNPARARWLTPSEREIVLGDLERDRSVAVRKSHGSLGPALHDYRFYLLMVMGYALLVSAGGVFLWLPTIIRNAGVRGIWNIGLLSSIPFLVGTIVQIAVARHSDRRFERRWHAAIPAVVGAVGWAALPIFQHNLAAALATITLATTGTLAAMGPFWTMPSALLAGSAGPAGIAIITTVAGFGSFLSPILVGWTATRTGSLAVGLYYFAAIMFLGALAMVLVGNRLSPVDEVSAAQTQGATVVA